jgi:hypothetical protein
MTNQAPGRRAGRAASTAGVLIAPDGVAALAGYLWGNATIHTGDLRRAAGREVHYRVVGRRAGGADDGLVYEHVVPVLILGLRRLVRKETAKQVLRLHRGCMVTKVEHQLLGSMRTDHPDLIVRAVLCPPEEAVEICLERYSRARIRLRLIAPVQ